MGLFDFTAEERKRERMEAALYERGQLDRYEVIDGLEARHHYVAGTGLRITEAAGVAVLHDRKGRPTAWRWLPGTGKDNEGEWEDLWTPPEE